MFLRILPECLATRSSAMTADCCSSSARRKRYRLDQPEHEVFGDPAKNRVTQKHRRLWRARRHLVTFFVPATTGRSGVAGLILG